MEKTNKQTCFSNKIFAKLLLLVQYTQINSFTNQ